MDMRFGTLGLKESLQVGSLKAVGSELLKCNLNLVAV